MERKTYSADELHKLLAKGPRPDLRFADLHGHDLTGVDLSGAYLLGADLSCTNLRNANLSGADLSSANLHGAYLCEANLSGADLCNANLSDTNLNSADLRNVNLDGANLTDAYLSKANLLLLGQDCRGYLFYACPGDNDVLTIRAGCRTFIGLSAARDHWNWRHKSDPVLLADCLSLVDRCERLATVRGWKLEP